MSIHLSKIHMKNNDWKERLNVVYSTNPDFNKCIYNRLLLNIL